MSRQVAVIGSGGAERGSELALLTEEVGRRLAEAGANPHCTHVVATGVPQARNLAVVSSGQVVIAVGGEWGTLSEIGLARAIGRTVVALQSWALRGYDRMEGAPGVLPVETPEEAVAAALAELG
jgi:hypothetical protein